MLVSKLTTPQPLEKLELVTFKSRNLRPKFIWSTDMTLTVVLIGLVLMLWTLFSPWGIAN
jgi:SSS family solute:Na+ symporter